MILKGSQRGGARQLAAHLLNTWDNDHVTVLELRGFVANDLRGAMAETHAIAKGTKCRQCVFSLSLNPPSNAEASIDDLTNAADRAGEALGLKDQPRAIVVHEKNGRRHAHVAWSRIDADSMKAINLPFFKERLSKLSKELYLEHGWELPEGHRTNGWKNPLNFTLAEWQQAKRLDLDPREVKQVFHSAWQRSDNQAGFRHALEESGFYLSRGDRRGVVAVDLHGEVFSVSRWAGVPTKALNAKLRDISKLPSVAQTRADLQKRLSTRLREHVRTDRQAQAEELRPIAEELKTMVTAQRNERARLKQRQDERWRMEAKTRADRLQKGIRGVWDFLTGTAKAIRRQNESETFIAYRRDREQQEALYGAQAKDRRALETRMDSIRARHSIARRMMTEKVVTVLRHARQQAEDRNGKDRPRDRGAELDLGR
ncbi:MAG: relaxase/mobilization nuclease domain-containing protein [Pseudomonadota bacterium]